MRIRSVADMEKAARDLRRWSEQIVTDSVKTLLHEIALSTPIDTTRLVSNWQVTLGAPASGEVAGAWTAPRSKGGGVTGEHAAWTTAVRNADKAIRSYRAQVDRSIWITNNVPYAEAVEMYGSSEGYSQAGPAMMVRGPIQDWASIVERAARKWMS